MSTDPLALLAAANPVPDPPAVDSVESLRCLREVQQTPARRARRRRTLVVITAVAGALAVTGVGLVLSEGSSGPGVDVAAAAYAATSPKSGTIEAVFVARIFRGSQAGGTLRQREWNDTAAGLRRQQYSTTGPLGDTAERHVLESASAPGHEEMWSAGPEASTINRLRTSRGVKTNVAFGGIALYGIEGIGLYRRVYREGLIRLVGRERHDGRLLWKLETPAHRVDRIGGVLSHTGLVVLVDPKTFLPVSVRQLDLALPGHPKVVESNLVSYRRLDSSEASPRIFDLAAQHPYARVIISPGPVFRRFHTRKPATVRLKHRRR